jgi:hypothetical protein
MKYLNYLMACLILLLAPNTALGELNTNTLAPECAVNSLVAGTCVPLRQGVRARASSALTTTDCETGGGSNVITCEYDGGNWYPVTSGIVGFGANGESILNTPDGTFDFTRDEPGAVTISCSDDNQVCAFVFGNGWTSSITFWSDSDYEFINSSSDSVTLNYRDYFDTTDDDMAHASTIGNCTTTTSGAEDCDFSVNTTEAGVVSSQRMLIDGDGDTVFAPERPGGGNGNGLTTNNQRRINGIPKVAGFSLGTGNDGSETVNTDFGDSETPDTDWAQTANITTSNEGTIIRMGTASLELLVGATPADGNGADCDLVTGNQDWTDDASFGMWMRCDAITDATYWVLEITDSGAGATEVVVPAVPVADHWTWVEVDISGVANASKDDITTIAIDLTAPGAAALADATCYFDYMWKWDDAEELAMGVDIYEDGILSMFSVITAGAAITPILEVEGTDWFVHYETGNDFVVPISDLVNDSLWGMAALE